MSWHCQRPGCANAAAATVTFDAVSCQAWIDPLVADHGGQVLCARHVERFSPPRGWVVLDRRDPEVSVMTTSPEVVAPSAPPTQPRRRVERTWGDFDEPALITATGNEPLVVDSEDTEAAGSEALAQSDDALLAPRGRLLSRAFGVGGTQRSVLTSDDPPGDSESF